MCVRKRVSCLRRCPLVALARHRASLRAPPPQALCWEHTVTAGVLRVNMSCGVDALNGKPSFCAVGFHQQGDASTNMAPAEVFFTAVVNGKAVIEDRYDKAGHSESVCAPKQVSYDIVSNVNNDGR